MKIIRKNIFGSTLAELELITRQVNAPKYRARQIAEWLYRRQTVNFDAMNNLPKELRERLAAGYEILRPCELTALRSSDGATVKFLLEVADKTAVETVLMRHDYGNSVCISTQAGCNMGCKFCASTLHGVMRDLTAVEMLAQVVHINDYLRLEDQKINTIVIMGSGEPLVNYDNVVAFIRLCHAEEILNLGYRNITLSTCGIVPRMYSLAQEGMPVTLSVSLHAPNDAIRSRLMPINDKYPMSEVIAAADNYAAITGRRITYEYILIAGVNDSTAAARQLAQRLSGKLANVNLIPVNPVAERGQNRPSSTAVKNFAEILAANRIAATVRREMGGDINAACGQLRNRFLENSSMTER